MVNYKNMAKTAFTMAKTTQYSLNIMLAIKNYNCVEIQNFSKTLKCRTQNYTLKLCQCKMCIKTKYKGK